MTLAPVVMVVLLLGGCVVVPPLPERAPLQLEQTCLARPPERLVRGRPVRSEELLIVPCAVP